MIMPMVCLFVCLDYHPRMSTFFALTQNFDLFCSYERPGRFARSVACTSWTRSARSLTGLLLFAFFFCGFCYSLDARRDHSEPHRRLPLASHLRRRQTRLSLPRIKGICHGWRRRELSPPWFSLSETSRSILTCVLGRRFQMAHNRLWCPLRGLTNRDHHHASRR